MNKHILLIFSFIVLFTISCDDEQPTFIDFDSYQWATLDEDGGTWKTVIIANNEAIAIPAPEAVAQTEIDEVKNGVKNITAAQKEIADYWTSNPEIRWNEIARNIAAKYNLAPAPNPDGTYSIPDATKPDSYPNFPFAHPPYSCRAFAYNQVATFDALIAAWHYKYKYNRASVSKTDATITPYFGANDLPSYPSEGAVITSVAQTILTAMFPLEKDYIAAKAAEHLESLTYTASSFKSDIEAGKVLGTEVAKLAMARAKADGMGKAQAAKPIADSIKKVAFDTYGWSFQNMEIPERKVGITANFGNVKTWSVPDVKAIRSKTPPAPGSAEFKKAEQELIDVAKNLTTEQRKIANFWSDGTSTYTPPGHWNRIASDNIILNKYNPLRSARTLAYLNMAIMDSGIACWETKYHYHYPRPNQIIPGFKTQLGTPNFPAYVSGHSTFSAAAADLLSHIFPSKQAEFTAFANEAAESRIYGGIHWRFDSEEGLVLGSKCAAFTVDKAKVDGAE